MQVYHVWQQLEQHLEWIEAHDDRAKAEQRADLFNRFRFSSELPIRYVVTGPHDETIDAAELTPANSPPTMPPAASVENSQHFANDNENT